MNYKNIVLMVLFLSLFGCTSTYYQSSVNYPQLQNQCNGKNAITLVNQTQDLVFHTEELSGIVLAENSYVNICLSPGYHSLRWEEDYFGDMVSRSDEIIVTEFTKTIYIQHSCPERNCTSRRMDAITVTSNYYFRP